MSYLVIVTFDITNGKSEDYECVYKGLEKIGLLHQINGDKGELHTLPSTTTAGKFNGQSTGSVRDDVTTKVEAVFKSCRVSGQVFVSVGDNWSWAIRYPK